MSEVGERTANMQSVMEKVLARLSEHPEEKPVALVIEFPAHFPPVALDEREVAALIGDLVQQVFAWTNRQEVRVQAQIVPTGGLPIQLDGTQKSDEGRSDLGPWALISISDQYAEFIADGDLIDVDLPSQSDKVVELRSVKQLALDQGILFWAEDLDEHGTCIWIALPLQEREVQETDVTRVRDTVDTRLGDSNQVTAKVLVQAENENVRDLLVDSLLEGGYQVASAQVSTEVLSLARREKPDLIILDLQSRNPAAMDLALFIRQEPVLQSTPVLFLTEIKGPGIGSRMETVEFLVQSGGATAILQTVKDVLHSSVKTSARIMIVEPVDELRENMIETIQRLDYPVVEARSAEEALALAERVTVGVVLAKAGLAQARDYWLVRQLRQLSDDIDIYIMTDGAPADDASQALLRGATGYGDTGRLGDLIERLGNNAHTSEDDG